MGCFLCRDPAAVAPLGESGVCADCGASAEERTRFWLLRQGAQLAEGAKVLGVSPSAAHARRFLAAFPHCRYTAIRGPLPGEALQLAAPHRFLPMEVTRLSFSDNSFDCILAPNVLPFVRSDYLAMSELHRCLRAEGVAVLDAPVEEGKTCRAAEAGSDEPGALEWRYGEDYYERLEAAGFFVLRLPSPGEGECVLCFKFRDAMERFLERVP